MVFSTTNLFKSIQCPAGAECGLTNCIFSHDSQPEDAAAQSLPTQQSTQPEEHQRSQLDSTEPAAKRRKVMYHSSAQMPISMADQIRGQLAFTRAQPPGITAKPEGISNRGTSGETAHLALSAKRPISPPANSSRKSIASTGTSSRATTLSHAPKQDFSKNAVASAKTEALNPRLVANDPAGHAKRTLYLKHLYAEMVRLNGLLDGHIPQDLKKSLPLGEHLLTKLALDEEEKVARESPSVYGNVMKQRISRLKKVPAIDWAKQIACKLSTEGTEARRTSELAIETHMNLQQECLILSHLTADQQILKDFEYIPDPPSSEQIQTAVNGVEHSRNYEECDRCSSRFQVFPDRNEQGLLASNGPCKFHPRRKIFPPRQKMDRETGSKEAYYPCCMEVVGTPGCTEHESHVFKTTSPGRLAAVLPFIVTPANPTPARDRHGKEVKAVTFDCEMGYTTCGFELIRLTAVTCPYNDPLVDVLVRPLGTVIDLNSRFSGVFPEHFRDAVPYETWLSAPETTDAGGSSRLPVVQNPQKAREILCSFLMPDTPLIGHAINNDLNAVRLCHPTIVDTVLLYPHPKGLPMRTALRALTQKYLNRVIQTGGDRGHDSKEDAIATGDLVRIKAGEKWRQLRTRGWKLIQERLIPPSPLSQSINPAPKSVGENESGAVPTGSKRKRSSPGAIDLTEYAET